MDDMRCATCDADVYGLDVRSVSVIEWDPTSRSNILLAVLCTDPRCLRGVEVTVYDLR